MLEKEELMLDEMCRSKELQRVIGGYCKEWRERVLGVALYEVMGKEKVKSVSAFEHGRANSVEYPFRYAMLTEKVMGYDSARIFWDGYYECVEEKIVIKIVEERSGV